MLPFQAPFAYSSRMDVNMQKQAAEAVLRRIRSNRFAKRAAVVLRKTAQEVDPYIQGLIYRNNLDLNDKDDLAYLERMLKQHDTEYKQPKTTWQASLSGFNEGAKDGMKVVRNTATLGLNKKYRQSAEEAMRGYSKGIRALTELSAATGVGALAAAGFFAAPEVVAASRIATLPGALKTIGGGTVGAASGNWYGRRKAKELEDAGLSGQELIDEKKRLIRKYTVGGAALGAGVGGFGGAVTRLGSAAKPLAGKSWHVLNKYVLPATYAPSVISAWDEYANGQHPGRTAHGGVKDISVPLTKTLGEAVWFTPAPAKWLNKGPTRLAYGVGMNAGANWYADKLQQDANARETKLNEPARQSLLYVDQDDPYGTAKGQWSPKKR